MKRLLIVHPEKDAAETLGYAFETDGYALLYAHTIAEAVAVVEAEPPQMLLIEMAFADGTGLDLVKRVKELTDAPIIVVSKVGEDLKKVLAFEYGVDDYVVEPYNILELKARMRAIFRRTKSVVTDMHREEYGDFVVNLAKRKIYLGEEDLNLTAREFNIFFTLLTSERVVFSREELRDEITEDPAGDLRVFDVHIKRLRKKLAKVSEATYIQTKWGEGYYYQKI